MKYLILFCIFSGEVLSDSIKQESHIPIGVFSSNTLEGWEEKVFDQQTSYVLTQIDHDIALKAQSNDSASGLFKELVVDIKKYPYLNWRWRIEGRLPALDETKKQGDDYAARIYVVVSGGLFFWRTKALNYVWSSRAEKDVEWPNAFAPDNAHMVAARTASDQTGVWYVEKRNIYEALKHWFGDEVSSIDAIAIMTDTDNSDGKATAFYGDIYFSAE